MFDFTKLNTKDFDLNSLKLYPFTKGVNLIYIYKKIKLLTSQ